MHTEAHGSPDTLSLSGEAGEVGCLRSTPERAEEVPCTGSPTLLHECSLRGLQGVWSDVQRMSQIRLLVVEKLSEDVEDHFSAQREVWELILLLLLRHEKLQPVAGDDRPICAIAAVKPTQTVRKRKGGKKQSRV